MDRGARGAARGDDGVEEDGEVRRDVGGGVGCWGWAVVGQVVVVFHRLEGDGVAEEAEVVDWDGSGEEGF